VTRWSKHALDQKALARQAAAMLIALKGSICVYQGEELGLPQADILFEELTDPPGIRFWPEYKGRDGERTPIPWDAGEAPNGFTSGKPWLPVKPNHSALAVAVQNDDPDSTLAFYRAALKFRREHDALIEGEIEFFAVGEPLLAFRRRNDSESLVCLYNLSPNPVRITLTGEAETLLSQHAGRKKDKLMLGPNGFAVFAETAGTPLQVRFRGKSARQV
jgi:alpha-glucosidase